MEFPKDTVPLDRLGHSSSPSVDQRHEPPDSPMQGQSQDSLQSNAVELSQESAASDPPCAPTTPSVSDLSNFVPSLLPPHSARKDASDGNGGYASDEIAYPSMSFQDFKQIEDMVVSNMSVIDTSMSKKAQIPKKKYNKTKKNEIVIDTEVVKKKKRKDDNKDNKDKKESKRMKRISKSIMTNNGTNMDDNNNILINISIQNNITESCNVNDNNNNINNYNNDKQSDVGNNITRNNHSNNQGSDVALAEESACASAINLSDNLECNVLPTYDDRKVQIGSIIHNDDNILLVSIDRNSKYCQTSFDIEENTVKEIVVNKKVDSIQINGPDKSNNDNDVITDVSNIEKSNHIDDKVVSSEEQSSKSETPSAPPVTKIQQATRHIYSDLGNIRVMDTVVMKQDSLGGTYYESKLVMTTRSIDALNECRQNNPIFKLLNRSNLPKFNPEDLRVCSNNSSNTTTTTTTTSTATTITERSLVTVADTPPSITVVGTLTSPPLLSNPNDFHSTESVSYDKLIPVSSQSQSHHRLTDSDPARVSNGNRGIINGNGFHATFDSSKYNQQLPPAPQPTPQPVSNSQIFIQDQWNEMKNTVNHSMNSYGPAPPQSSAINLTMNDHHVKPAFANYYEPHRANSHNYVDYQSGCSGFNDISIGRARPPYVTDAAQNLNIISLRTEEECAGDMYTYQQMEVPPPLMADTYRSIAYHKSEELSRAAMFAPLRSDQYINSSSAYNYPDVSSFDSHKRSRDSHSSRLKAYRRNMENASSTGNTRYANVSDTSRTVQSTTNGSMHFDPNLAVNYANCDNVAAFSRMLMEPEEEPL